MWLCALIHYGLWIKKKTTTEQICDKIRLIWKIKMIACLITTCWCSCFNTNTFYNCTPPFAFTDQFGYFTNCCCQYNRRSTNARCGKEEECWKWHVSTGTYMMLFSSFFFLFPLFLSGYFILLCLTYKILHFTSIFI